MTIKIIFQNGMYHKHKNDIKKIREKIGCTTWGGGKWFGDNILISPSFVRTGSPQDFLILSGTEDKIKMFTDKCSKFDVTIEHVEDKINTRTDVTAKIENFLSMTEGMKESFRQRWIALIKDEVA